MPQALRLLVLAVIWAAFLLPAVWLAQSTVTDATTEISATVATHTALPSDHHVKTALGGSPYYVQFVCADGVTLCGLVDLRWDPATETLHAKHFLSDNIDGSNGFVAFDNPTGYTCAVTGQDFVLVADSLKGGLGNYKVYVCRPDGTLYEVAVMEASGRLRATGFASVEDEFAVIDSAGAQGPYTPFKYGIENSNSKFWSTQYFLKSDVKALGVFALRTSVVRGMYGAGSDQNTTPISARDDINISLVEGKIRLAMVRQEATWTGAFKHDDRFTIDSASGFEFLASKAGGGQGGTSDLYIQDDDAANGVNVTTEVLGFDVDTQWPNSDGRLWTRLCETFIEQGAISATSDHGWMRFSNQVQLESFACIMDAVSSTVTVGLEQCDGNLDNCNVIATSNLSCVETAEATATPSGVNSLIDPGERLRLDFSSPTGTSTHAEFTVCYRQVIQP